MYSEQPKAHLLQYCSSSSVLSPQSSSPSHAHMREMHLPLRQKNLLDSHVRFLATHMRFSFTSFILSLHLHSACRNTTPGGSVLISLHEMLCVLVKRTGTSKRIKKSLNQVLLYADNINLLGEIINTTKKNTEIP
jgi:hypothetical protein